ncbi:MAG TPA: tetratricopeptide repeat protein [Puia sp.]|nr:tetratricopeptide repeat protein [Puia sp.]
MKKFKAALASLLIAPFVIFSCNMHEDGEGSKDLLKKMPYAKLTDSIARFPDSARLYLERGEMLNRNNQHEIARADFKKSWELGSSERSALAYVSSLSITNRTAEATKLLEECIRKFPANEEFKRLLSEIYMQSGRSAEAIALFGTILRTDSNDAEAWYEKGRLLAQAHDTPDAIASVKKAYRLEPTVTFTLELADLYAESNNAAALPLCDLVIVSDSARELTDPFFIKGIYYSNTKQYDEAIVQFDSCIGRDWKLTDAYIEKGIAFFKEKNFDNALNTFRMAAAVTLTSPDSYFWIGRCYEAINKKQEAAQYYQKALLLDRDFKEALEALKRVNQ